MHPVEVFRMMSPAEPSPYCCKSTGTTSKPSTGTLPVAWFQLFPRLAQFRIGGCSMSGSLPSQLLGLPRLESIVLPHNNLSGTLPVDLVPKLQVSKVPRCSSCSQWDLISMFVLPQAWPDH